MLAEAFAIWEKFQQDFKKFGPKRLRRMDEIDWWTQLKQLGFQPEDLLRRDMMDSTDFGETIRMTSVYTAATEYLSSKAEKVDDSDEMDFKVRGGNSRLVETLAKKIGLSNIRTEQIVFGIREVNKRVHVQVAVSGTPIIADYCVCAIPAHCIIDIDWGNEPPTKHLEAASQMQYARITKTAVLCSRRFWPEPESGGYSVCTNLASDFCFDSTYKQKSTKGILCSYAVGDKAVDIASSPQDKLKYWIVEDVANANGLNWSANESQNVALAMQQQAWQANPFTRGAYGFYRPGQWFTVRNALQKRFGHVFFAGEHIADWQGFMEGAIQTGYDAAKAILRD